MKASVGERSKTSTAKLVAPAARPVVRLDYGRRLPRRRRSSRPWWLTFLGYFGSAVAIGLITIQTFHVIQGVRLLILPRVQITVSWLGPNTRVIEGLMRWQISVLIFLSLLAISVSAMLLVGSRGILTRRASALTWMRRYALWQTATVMPTAAVVVCFAEGIVPYDYVEHFSRSAGVVRDWALIQAAIAIIWSIIVLRLVTFRKAIDYWRRIEKEESVPLARVAEQPDAVIVRQSYPGNESGTP
jgi:hypothetical protein